MSSIDCNPPNPIVTTNSIDNPALREHADAIRDLTKRTLDNVIEIGRRLTEAKVLAGYGNWSAWLEREFGWSQDTAKNLMNVFEQSRIRNFRNLNLPISALYLISASSTPDEVRDGVITRAETGEPVTVAEVRKAIVSIRSPCSRSVPSGEPAPIAAPDPEPTVAVPAEIDSAGDDVLAASADSAVSTPTAAGDSKAKAKAKQARKHIREAVDLVGEITTAEMAFALIKKADRRDFIERMARAVH